MHALAATFSALLLAIPCLGQRVIPPTREIINPPATRHLKAAAPNVRGTYFVLARNESAEAFWSRYEDNRASAEFRMAILAREGINQVRQFSSYRAYLYGVYRGFQANGHWSRVRDFCDMAHDYDIAVSLVLLNTFGYDPGDSSGPGTGTIPAQRIVTDGLEHVRLRLNCFLPGCTTWHDIRLWVGHPDNLSPFAADPTELFPSAEWCANAPNSPFPDFLDGYVTQMNSGTLPPTTSRGLQEFEFVNEPEHLRVSTTIQGAQCLKMMQKVALANPRNLGLVLATAAPRSLAWRLRNCTSNCYTNPIGIEMLSSGFDDADPTTPSVARLDHWTMHGAMPHVFHHAQDSTSPHYNSATFDYVRGIFPNEDFLPDLRNHPTIVARGNAVPRVGLVHQEAVCRAGTLQRMSDLQRYMVLDINPNPGVPSFNRVGVNTWSHFTSDAVKADQPSILPCGFTLSPYEREAFNDNWRALTSSGALPNPSDPAAAGGTVNPGVVVVDQDLSDAVKVGLAQSGDGKAMLVVYADNYSAKLTHSIRTSNPETHAKANTLFARVRWENPTQPGTWLWFPALGQPAVVLDASPGPLVFDEGRRAIASLSQLDTTVVDTRYRTAMGYVNDSEYDGVDLVGGTFPPYLRQDILDLRVKRRNADCDLAPSVVFQRQVGSLYRFFVAWSRPVPKTALLQLEWVSHEPSVG